MSTVVTNAMTGAVTIIISSVGEDEKNRKDENERRNDL